MFGKLLKHDLRSVWRAWWPVIPTASIASTALALMIRYLIVETGKIKPFTFGCIMAVFGILIAYFIFMLTPLYSEILCYLRFYKNLYTDEGYLTFTLPVKRSEVLRSKTLTTVIFTISSMSLIALGIVWITLLAVPTSEKGQFFINFAQWKSLFIDGFISLINLQNVWWLLLYLIELLVIVVLSTFYSVALIEFCLTLGATVAKKAKLFVGILVYIGVTSIMGFIMQIISYFGIFSLGMGIDTIVLNMSATALHVAIAILLLIFCIAIALFGAFFYCLTRNILERKLNLA